jgi:phage/plasmid-like protein (TIGR03299 family)
VKLKGAVKLNGGAKMAHNINEGRMFYVGEKPWHGIGQELANPATAAEAIAAARLDYPIELQELFAANGSPVFGRKAAVRKDSGVVVGVVGDRYQPIQNVDAFSFFDTLVGEGQAIYHTAGALGRGERIWILAKLPKDIILTREDVVEKYLVLMNSHDGTSSLRCFFTPVRVVCQNTLNMSLKDASKGVSIRHTGNLKSKVEDARRVLGITVSFYQQWELIAKQLIDVKLSVEKTESYFDKVVFGDEPVDEKSTQLMNRKSDLLSLFEGGKGNKAPEVRHSLWAAYNAVTEYSDHYRTVRSVEKDPSRRLNDAWFGAGADLKETAYDVALEFAGINLANYKVANN